MHRRPALIVETRNAYIISVGKHKSTTLKTDNEMEEG